MIRDEFYVTLPSDSSMKLFPDNKTTHFISQLPRNLTLQGEWTVALVEIEYPQNIQTFSDTPDARNITFSRAGKWKYTVTLPDKVWKDAKEIIAYLQANPEFSNHFSISVSPTDIVTIQMNRPDDKPCVAGDSCVYEEEDVYIIVMSKTLTKILGLPNTIDGRYILIFNNNRTITGILPASLNRAIPNSLYIYTDICEPCIVGDVETPLLRVVPVDIKKYNYARTKSFNPPQPRYIPLIRNSFQTIEIDIRDNLSDRIPFESGTLIVTLHFKRSF